LLAANALLGRPLRQEELLNLGTEMEGHSDNVASALLGGLVVSTQEAGGVLARRIAVKPQRAIPMHITIVLPDFHISTKEARAALPERISLKDAVHNISRAVLVTEAFRTGDMNLLGSAMTDTLHQPYRLALIPGAQAAMESAKAAGAAAVALSGAGPSLIAFCSTRDPAIGEAMKRAFEHAGLPARLFQVRMSDHGAEVHI
jgi:homoserine kinase